MIELLTHLGLSTNTDPTLNSIFYKAKGLFIWYIILHAIFLYFLVSFICFLSNFSFPEASIDLKRKACILFYNFCIYLAQLNGVHFDISGDHIQNDLAIFIANHQSLADYLSINYLSRYSLSNDTNFQVPMVNFFTWFTLWRVPGFKVLINLCKCDENWELDSLLIGVFFKKIVSSKKIEWLVTFPEVNIFTSEASKLQKIQCDKFYLPSFNHLLYPRFSSFSNAISMARSSDYKFNRLYDLTIYYYKLNDANEKVFFQPTLLDIFSCEGDLYVNIIVKFKSIVNISNNRNKLEKWLEKNWIEKDKYLNDIYSS